MEYAGKVTHREYWNATAILYAYLAGGKALWLQFLCKANFSLLQRNKFNYYHGGG